MNSIKLTFFLNLRLGPTAIFLLWGLAAGMEPGHGWGSILVEEQPGPSHDLWAVGWFPLSHCLCRLCSRSGSVGYPLSLKTSPSCKGMCRSMLLVLVAQQWMAQYLILIANYLNFAWKVSYLCGLFKYVYVYYCLVLDGHLYWLLYYVWILNNMSLPNLFKVKQYKINTIFKMGNSTTCHLL